jgi:salicylate hydroxylase
MAIEDAETLGGLFSRLQHRSQISRMLAAYEEIRQPRSNYAQDWELRRRAMVTAPPGKQQEKRDAGLRRMMAYNDWTHINEQRFLEMVRLFPRRIHVHC